MNTMTGIERYLKRERWYIAGMLVAFLLVETSINATSLMMEAREDGKALAAWIPFVLEYTSGLSLLLLFRWWRGICADSRSIGRCSDVMSAGTCWARWRSRCCTSH